MDASEERPPEGGLKPALARLAESIVGAVRTRGELASAELVEERERLVLRLSLLVAGAVVLAFAVLFAGAFVIVLFWDTHRLTAIAVVAIVHAVAGALLVAKARAIGRDAPPPFAATLAELEKDRTRLARATHGTLGQDEG
jgi:uncharacterized membrane protein YqjE